MVPGPRIKGGEFGLISELLAPLAAGSDWGLGLADDAALMRPADGCELVVTKDLLVAGVHFPTDEAPDRVARKLLRVNLSDLAAMGAVPKGYLLGLALAPDIDDAWMCGFVDGLAADQADYGIVLIGGDIVASAGGLVLSLTAIGEVPAGGALRRSGAEAGDHLFVTGTLGDAALGLRLVQGDLAGLAAADADYLAGRYRLPCPRTTVGPRLIGLAHAAIDISDGLLADLEHVCRASGLAAVIDETRLPLSAPARRAIADNAADIDVVLAGGDDYELLFALAPARAPEVAELARETGVPITEIGRFEAGAGVCVLDARGRPHEAVHKGYTHF